MIKYITVYTKFKWILLITIPFLLIVGCGRKMPPVPPKYVPPSAIDDLSYDIFGNSLSLTWTMPEPSGDSSKPINGFIIYRSKEKMPVDCESCPLIFEEIGEIVVNNKDQKFKFQEELKKGFQYTYKVKAYVKKRLSGKDSNVVKFAF